MSKLRAAIYCRISKEDRDGRAAGVESTQVQEATATRVIEASGWTLVETFVDQSISGAEFLKRPALQRMLRAAEAGAFDLIVCRDLDRIGRDPARLTSTLVRLDDAGVRVFSYVDGDFAGIGGAGLLVTTVKGVVAEGTRRSNNQNIRAALRRRAEMGRATTRAPFGYRIVHDEHTKAKTWAIDDDRAAVVDRLARTFVAKKSFHATAVALNDAGLRSPSGGSWSPRTVAHILTSPVYRGVVKHGRTRFVERRGTRVVERAPDSEVVTVQRPDLALWKADLIEKVDALLSSNSRKPFGPATPKHLASSFVRCVHCGSAIVCVPSRRQHFATYTCNKMLQHGKAACIGIGYRSERAVDRALLDAVKPFVAGPVAERAMEILAARVATLSQPDGINEERDRLVRVLVDAERRATKLAKAIGEAENNEFLIEQLRTETKRVEGLRAELSRLNTQRPDQLSGRRLLATVKERLVQLTALAAKGGVEARPVLRAVLGEGNRFEATAVEVNGEKRWQLSAEISGGYLLAGVSPTSGNYLKQAVKGTITTIVTPPAAPAPAPVVSSPVASAPQTGASAVTAPHVA